MNNTTSHSKHSRDREGADNLLPEPRVADSVSLTSLQSKSLRCSANCRDILPQYRRRAATMIVALIAWLPAACQTTPRNESKIAAEKRWDHVRADIKLQMATQALEGARYEDAVKNARNALVLNPNLPVAYAVAARAELAMDNDTAARELLDRAAEAEVRSAELSYLKGVVLERSGRPEEALGHYATARDAKPAHTGYLMAQAHCLLNLERGELALRLLNEHAATTDDPAAVAMLTATIAEDLGRWAQALRAYRKAVAAGMRDTLVLERFARLLADRRQHQEVVSILEPLMSDLPAGADGTIRQLLATSLLALRQPTRARAVIESFGAANPSHAVAQALRAQASLATGDVLDAMRVLDRARRNGIHDTALSRLYGLAQFQCGNVEAARATLQELIATNPDDVESHCLLAEIAIARQDAASARLHFRTAREIDPSCVWASEGLRVLKENTTAGATDEGSSGPSRPQTRAATVVPDP